MSKLRIERPVWDEIAPDKISLTDTDCYVLNNWFDANVQPINELLAGGVEVDGKISDYGAFEFQDLKRCVENNATHTALLIGVQPLVKETAESLLKEYVEHLENGVGFSMEQAADFINRYRDLEKGR